MFWRFFVRRGSRGESCGVRSSRGRLLSCRSLRLLSCLCRLRSPSSPSRGRSSSARSRRTLSRFCRSFCFRSLSSSVSRARTSCKYASSCVSHPLFLSCFWFKASSRASPPGLSGWLEPLAGVLCRLFLGVEFALESYCPPLGRSSPVLSVARWPRRRRCAASLERRGRRRSSSVSGSREYRLSRRRSSGMGWECQLHCASTKKDGMRVAQQGPQGIVL